MREIEKLQATEYALKYRHGPRKGEPSHPRDQVWRDGSGFNNPDSVYHHLKSVNVQISRLRGRLQRQGYTNIEFLILTREVTRTEWRQLDD